MLEFLPTSVLNKLNKREAGKSEGIREFDCRELSSDWMDALVSALGEPHESQGQDTVVFYWKNVEGRKDTAMILTVSHYRRAENPYLWVEVGAVDGPQNTILYCSNISKMVVDTNKGLVRFLGDLCTDQASKPSVLIEASNGDEELISIQISYPHSVSP